MDDLDLVRRLGDVPEPDADAAIRARATLMEALVRERAVVRPTSRGTPSGARARHWKVAAVLATAAVAMALAVPALLPAGTRGGADPAAAAALLRASRVAASQTAKPAPGPGQYVYTKSKSEYVNEWADAGPGHEGFAVVMPEVREAWISLDGAGRLLETTGTPTFVSGRDRAVWEAAGRPDLGGNQTTDESFQAGPEGLFYMDLSNLPTDPGQLKEMIERRQIEGGPPGDAETFTIIGDMLRETFAPPALRAALFQIAAELPGVEYLGPVQDAVGRQGVAVAYTSGGARHELIFDPQTSALLGERYVGGQAGPEAATGALTQWAVYESSGVVDSTSERP